MSTEVITSEMQLRVAECTAERYKMALQAILALNNAENKGWDMQNIAKKALAVENLSS